MVYHVCGIDTTCQKYFFQILPLAPHPSPPKNAQVVNLEHPDLDLIRRIHPECGFYGFMIRFWICPKNANSIFGFGNPDLDFPQKTHPQTPYFLPALTPALTSNLHKRGKYKRQHILGLKICQNDDQFKIDMTGVSCHLLVPW